MTTPRTAVGKKRTLEILGISEAEECAYRWLITHHGATMPEIAQALALTSNKTQRLLDAIEAKGLTTHAPERPRRYVPASPDIALEALALQHQEELQHARGTIEELQQQAAAAKSQGQQEQVIELITSRAAERQAFEQMHRVAQHEVIALIRAPLRISRLDIPIEQEQHTQREAHHRGVNYRGIVDAEFMNLPGAPQAIREEMEAGQEIRGTAHLPFKMILADRFIALIPLNLQQADSPVLLVRSSALLDGLYVLFEMLWKHAAPLSLSHTGDGKIGNTASGVSEETKKLIQLMVAGLNDKKIAPELGISASTLTRRISEIMKAFDARTRFQLGYLIDRSISNRDK